MRSPLPFLRRRRRWLVAAAAGVLLVTVIAPWVYLNVIRDDPPERLTLADATSTTAGADPAASGSDTAPAPEGLDGTWVVGEGSQVGYRVAEVLFGQEAEAVGRTAAVTGSIEIDGTTVLSGSFSVDMATFESDESRRDGQFRGRIMEVSTFPTASFELTRPIEIPPAALDGDQVTTEAVGDLTLHGVTREVSIPLDAVLDGSTFAVNGRLLVTFSDYDIADPSGGPAQVGGDGELEILLVFVR